MKIRSDYVIDNDYNFGSVKVFEISFSRAVELFTKALKTEDPDIDVLSNGKHYHIVNCDSENKKELYIKIAKKVLSEVEERQHEGKSGKKDSSAEKKAAAHRTLAKA